LEVSLKVKPISISTGNKKNTKADNLNFFRIIYERLGNMKLSLESYYCRRE
jgi:hypothetical protein